MAITIKPLNWSQSPPPGHEHTPFVYWAAGLGGHYSVHPDGLLWMAHDGFIWEQHPNPEAARKAAQDDHDKRVRAIIIEESP